MWYCSSADSDSNWYHMIDPEASDSLKVRSTRNICMIHTMEFLELCRVYHPSIAISMPDV